MSTRWRVSSLAAAVLVLGLAATAGATFGFDRDVHRDRARRFEAAAERARGAVDARLEQHTQNLSQLRSWMLVNPGVTRAEFHAFTTLGFEERLYPGVQALTFSPLVNRSEVGSFEAAVQAELAATGADATFEVHPDGDRPQAYIVSYIEPLAGNEPAFGFDLGSDSSRLRAIEAARDGGGAAGSGPVRLVQEAGDQIGFVLFAAVYDTGDIPSTAPARRRHLTGVVGTVFRVGDLFAGVLGVNPETDAEIYDLGPTADPPDTRYDSSTRLLDTDGEATVSPTGTVQGLYRDLDLNIGDRRWRMVLTPAAGFAEGATTLPLVVAILGGLISVLLACVVQFAAQARGRAERRATEMTADLRAAEERSRSILVGAPDATLVVDAAGTIAVVNVAAETLFDYSEEELVGQPIEKLLPDSLRIAHLAHRASFATTPRRREMGAGLELLARRRDGETFPVEVSLSPLVGSGGAPEVIAAVRDVSAQRKAQAALQAALDNERETAEHLREADELKTAFLNTVSHELQTPLTAISGFTDVLLARPLPPEQHDDYLRRVRRNAQGLSTLISEVLAFARLERHDVELQPVRLDLVAEARLILDHLAPVLERHTIVSDAPAPVFAEMDREAFVRILTNLLSNATRYSPSGSTITVSIHQHGDRALVAVSDEGPGIPVGEEERVFDRFFRGTTALNARVPGTGIGLSVVRELVERSGGTVRVAPSERGGARFEVDLPISTRP